MGELGRVDPIAPGIAWLEEAIDEVPTDGQLRLWHAYMSYMDAWVCGDEAASSTALELL